MNYSNGYSDYGYSQPNAHQGATYPPPNHDQSDYSDAQYAQYHDTVSQHGQQTLDAFHIPNSGQQYSWGADPNSSQQYPFGTFQHSGYNPPLDAQSAVTQCTCGYYNGYHEVYCPQHHNSQGESSNTAHYGYSAAATQPSTGYNQYNFAAPGYLSPMYGPTPSNPAASAPIPLPSPTATPSNLPLPGQASPPRPGTPQKPSHGNPHLKSSLAAAWASAVTGVGALAVGVAQMFKNSN